MKNTKFKTKTLHLTSKFSLKKSYLKSILGALLLVAPIGAVKPHGTVTYPPSRTWVCYQENPENPDSPACAAAIIGWGTKAFYDWNEVARMDADGRHRELIADGNLASAGRPDKYGGLDQVRNDWVATPVRPGPLTLTWTNSAPHETLYYRVYITKADWTPDQPLTWDSLELLIETDPRPAAATDNIDLVLPQRKGKHVLYSVWQRSLSAEAFYATSDVDFGSGLVDNVAPQASFAYQNGDCGGPSVQFDASSTSDANGDQLTYTWDFGDGTTAQGATVSHQYNGLGSTLVTLTVSDGEFSSGATEIINLVPKEDCEESVVCPFDTPRSSPLPTVNETYNYAFVIGDNGPDFEGIYKFFINWDLNNKGLYNLDYQTLSTYTSFRSSVTHNFDQANPEVTFSGTNIDKLDGAYYVTLVNGNLALVSKTGDFVIYFSTSDTPPDCGDEDVSFAVNGGILTSDKTFSFVVQDGIADQVLGISLLGNTGQSKQWVVADPFGVILELPDGLEDIDFDSSAAGRSYIYNLSYNGEIQGLAVGNSTFSLVGDFDYSNSIEVTKTDKGSLSVGENEYTAILTQNYPNPFVGKTTIAYTLKEKSSVNISIYNIQGRLIQSIDRPGQIAGAHELTIDLSTRKSGVYLYAIRTKDASVIRPMILR